jgi:hypothetical protein
MTTCVRCGGLRGQPPDLQVTQDRLLANQTDIGNAVKPCYGEDAGNHLTALLQQHIMTAVGVLKTAKTGNPTEVDQAKAAFYANGNQIADFLHGATRGTGRSTRCRT